MDFRAILKGLGTAATNPLAFVAYLFAVAAWLILRLRVDRNKNLLASLTKVPERDRYKTLRDEMGVIELKEGLSPEQFLRSRIHFYYLLGFVVLCVVVVILFAIAVFQPKPTAHLRVNVVRMGASHQYVEDVIVTVKGDDGTNHGRTYSELSGGITMYEIPYGNYKIQIDGNGQTVTQQMTISSPWAETTIQFPYAPQGFQGATAPQPSTDNKTTKSNAKLPAAPAQRAALREVLPKWEVTTPCRTPFRPGYFSNGNIYENGQTGLESSELGKITGTNNSARNGSAMFDVKQVGTANFDNSTTVGDAEILKADKVDKLTATNNRAYAGPRAMPAPESSHAFNVGDWFDFMEDYEQYIVNKDAAKAEAEIKRLRERLASEWDSLPPQRRLTNQKELEEVLAAMNGNSFNVHYRDWPPSFVPRPCN
jgi:hypothetical protein